MADFVTLQTRVKRRVIDLPASVIAEVPDLINEAIKDIADDHNFQVMRETVTATTVDAARTLVAIPSDFKEFRGRPYFTADLGPVTQITIAPNEQAALKAFGAGSADDKGTPRVLALGDLDKDGAGNINIYPLPDSLSDYSDGDYRLTVPYWKFLAALSADADTNWFTVNAIQWILDKATAEAFALNWDEAREAQWQGRAAASRTAVIKQDKRTWLAGMSTFVPFRGAREAKIRTL